MMSKQSELEVVTASKILFVNTCRICLKPGEIPIFGDDEMPNISGEVMTFSATAVSKDDELPQHICNSCHELLRNAIRFREMAKRSDIAVKSNKKIIEAKNVSEQFSNWDWNNKNHFYEYCSDGGSIKLSSDGNFNGKSVISFQKGLDKSKHENNTKDLNGLDTILSNSNRKEVKDDIQMKHRAHCCENCKIDFETYDGYYKHIGTTEHINKVKASDKIECNVCKKLICRVYYVSHVLKHSFEPIICLCSGIYKCKLCNKLLLSEDEIKMHKDSDQHRLSAREAIKVECAVCHGKFSKTDIKSHLKGHVSEFAKGERHKCPICSKYFNLAYYYNHLKRMHNKDRKNGNIAENKLKNKYKMPFVCDMCGNGFETAQSFKVHCRTHGEVNYKCMLCRNWSIHQGLLSLHVRTHTGDYNNKWEQRSTRFLTKNMNRHLGTTDYKMRHFKKR